MHQHNLKYTLFAISVDFMAYKTHLTLQNNKYAVKKWMMHPVP
jgi:hypothetical protein